MKKLTKIMAVSAVALSTTAYAHNNDLIKDKAQAKQVCQIEKVDQVFKLMSERATLISEVAANKYITGGSVSGKFYR